MGEWRGWREYSYGKQNPADEEEFTMPSLDIEFCRSCSISMENLIEVRKMMDFYQNVLNWDDSAAEEAFRDAKRRYWDKRNQLPCNLPLPNDDFYLTVIDWHSVIDPELLVGSDRIDEDDIIISRCEISRCEDTVEPRGWNNANIKPKPTGWDVPDESDKPTGRDGTKLPIYVGYIEDDGCWGYPDTCESSNVEDNSSRQEQCRGDNGHPNSNPSCGEWKNDNYGSTIVPDSCYSGMQDFNLNCGGGNHNEKYVSSMCSGRNNYCPPKGSLASSRDEDSSRKYRSKEQGWRNYEPAKTVSGSDALQDLKLLQVPSKTEMYSSNDNNRRNYGPPRRINNSFSASGNLNLKNGFLSRECVHSRSESSKKPQGIAKELKWKWVPVNEIRDKGREMYGSRKSVSNC